MNKKLLAILVISSFSITAHAADDKDSGRITVFAGASNISSNFHNPRFSVYGGTLGAEFGFNKYASINLAGTYASFDESNFHSNSQGDTADGWAINTRLMGKLGYPIENLSGKVRMTPYAMLGLAVESYKLEQDHAANSTFNTDDGKKINSQAGLAYGVGADIIIEDVYVIGVSYNRSNLDTSHQQTSLTLGYRF
ncbi:MULTISPECIES: porin family protein [Vibrio]|uniref:Outer membrane protein beta-barrel domain-containing protein n=1 Tax=Vibrio ezurae NBRC 102218 TaxID=1219080 RepID=U3CFM9_9VIBR|nr:MULTISPECIES: porin family protein [Vibrio]GAD80034.1 hypothetical protein VEZ01S_22_00420 [Vibrio ezurae NBRC 102218]